METLLAISLLLITTGGLVLCDVKLARQMSKPETVIEETSEN